MTMLKTFDLKGNKKSFAEWISNLSPCETPFISMINKEKVDQVQYSWQTDALSKAAAGEVQEGSVVTFTKPAVTKVHTNFTQIFRKAVRVSDTTKKVSLYGRGSELAYQMEKAGMEIKRDVEHHFLNTLEEGRPGTTAAHGVASGVQKLVAARNTADSDTGGIVHKTVTSEVGKPAFSKEQVFDLTYNLYLVGSKADKIMFHPIHMHVFSNWIGAHAVETHVARMFEGDDVKFNSFVSRVRDPLGQEFELIPNRYMPKNQLFFFNASDWTQMVLREPTQVELAKNGSSEKHMIEMELGLRHRNPFASGILEFSVDSKFVLKAPVAAPANLLADGSAESLVSVEVMKSDGTKEGSQAVSFTASTINDDGSSTAATITAQARASGKASAKVKHTKGARIKVEAAVGSDNRDPIAGDAVIVVDAYESRD